MVRNSGIIKIFEKEKYGAKLKLFVAMSDSVKLNVRKGLWPFMKLERKTKITKNTGNSKATARTKKIASIEKISLKNSLIIS